jgi:hypothetical protein
MSKNIHFLYQQYQNGAYTQEEFENLKDYIEISFFDVDIPQEIVEFYNENLPEEEYNEGDTENITENNIIRRAEELYINNNEEEKEKEKDKIRFKNRENYFNNNLNKSKSSTADKSLIEENLKLKQQIIELKALNLQRQLKHNNNNNENDKNKTNKDTNRTIEGDYKRVLELINELNEVMNDIENKKNKSKKNKKEKEKVKEKENNININNNNLIAKNEQNKSEESKKGKEKEKEKDKKQKEEEKKEMERLKEIERKEKERQKEIEKMENEKKLQEQKEKEKEKEEKLKKEKMEKEKIKKEKEKEKNIKEKDLKGIEDVSKKPMPYQEFHAEPSEENKTDNNGSQFIDDEGNVFNFDDLTEEEKMNILHQQLILQKLEEEAAARGEQFDPQEYLAYLEHQAEEEEMQMKESNKLNKSF